MSEHTVQRNEYKIFLSCEDDIKIGDIVVIHQNVFRTFYDMKGKKKKSRSYFKDDLYFCAIDQVYLYKNKKGRDESLSLFYFTSLVISLIFVFSINLMNFGLNRSAFTSPALTAFMISGSLRMA